MRMRALQASSEDQDTSTVKWVIFVNIDSPPESTAFTLYCCFCETSATYR